MERETLDRNASEASDMVAPTSDDMDIEMDSGGVTAAIEAGGTDEEGEFSYSDYDEESMADSASSIGSSIYQHTFHNGRRYHRFRYITTLSAIRTHILCVRYGRYPIPNDDIEQNREDMLHAMMLEATNGQLFFAPIPDNPQRILDLGTGTGIWAIEMAGKYPSAEVLGLDLSPIQPVWIPANCRFMVDDIGADTSLQVEDTWENGGDWDFVHLRNMVPILKNLKPGAWVELQDVDGSELSIPLCLFWFTVGHSSLRSQWKMLTSNIEVVHCDDGTLPPDWPILRFTNMMVEAFARFGTKSHAAVFGGQYLTESGFVNIRHHAIKLPYGTWPRDRTMRLIGLYYRTAAEQFLPASQYLSLIVGMFNVVPTRNLGAIQLPMMGWQPEEIEAFFARCRDAMRDPNVHAYGMMHFWSGQKPLSA
ncbi:hypothetical protein RRF57_010604 [Xylaria bambusicola]|uniref:Methyltransferase domain-containing protein n=1 Tax=Xylaria bambusicola TaxID=326684 RepID=A0AAN7Z8M9_9PEZI